jgi:hypothetical protein
LVISTPTKRCRSPDDGYKLEIEILLALVI